jgi:hypothetical protein
METAALRMALIQIGPTLIAWRSRTWRTGAFVGLDILESLHFLGGAVVSALPLRILPCVPAQSLAHDSSYIVDGAAQIPLLWFLAKWLLMDRSRDGT